MLLKLQKRLAADVAGCSPKRIVFDQSKLEDIKEAITKADIRNLLRDGTIKVLPARGVSRVRANETRERKSRGLRRGAGSRKGRASARNPGKRAWIKRIRAQRSFLRNVHDRGIVTHKVYKDLYAKAAGGLFRSVKHIQIFMQERNLVMKPEPKQVVAQTPKKKAEPKKAKKTKKE